MSKLLLLAVLLLVSLSSWGKDRSFFLKQIPVLHEGRIKPFDTYARLTLKEFLQKDSLSDLGPTDWLLEVLFDQKEAFKRRIFKINNPDVLKILHLSPVKDHSYNFIEVFSALGKVDKQVDELLSLKSEELTPDQKQLTTLYNNVFKYLNLSRSFSMFLPDLEIDHRELAESLILPMGKKLSYYEVIQTEWRLRHHLKISGMKDQMLLLAAAKIIRFMKLTEEDKFANSLKIIPPQAVTAGQNFSELSWFAPWEIDLMKPAGVLSLGKWHDLYRSYKNDDQTFIQTSRSILDQSIAVSGGHISATKMSWEVRYNKYKLFYVAFALYLMAFLISIGHVLTERKTLKTAALLALLIGAIAHFLNLGIRCYLLSRPPVSNLYESILFVGLIGVFFSFFMDRLRYQYGALIGSIIGSILLLVSFGYEKEGDSLGMLVAVLDTNFWLSAHVITISIGYGCALVTSLMAHLFLARKTMAQGSPDPHLKKQIHYCSLFSLFFVIVGTMLGGIWADQSWGRFWGWDPKENGALLICLWLLWVIHGKIARILKENSYMLLTAMTSVVVVLAWFGVNLLNVGLHSYGFTENIANNIMIFVVAEFLINGFFFLRLRNKCETKEVFPEPAEDSCLRGPE